MKESFVMKDVFCGFVFDSDKESELLAVSKIGLQVAANQYQIGFLRGLANENINIISALSTGAFPRLNRRLLYKSDNKHTEYGKIDYLPFVNLPLLRDFMFERGVYHRIEKAIKSGEDVRVFVYSLYMPFLNSLKRLKKKYGGRFHVCLIIPDLSGKYGIMRSKHSLRGFKDRIEAEKKMRLANSADSFVFLTDSMKELFDEKPYAVIEGFLPHCEFNYENERQSKTVLYTGSLNPAFGITTLLKAFESISDPDYRLWICGAGDGQASVEAAAKKDSRIIYKGFLPKSEIADLQTKCDVLINPRPAEGEYTKYSFPSKTMEYLLSGSKVVMHRLDGIGDEYYKYIRVIDEHTPEAMAKSIVDACEDQTFYPEACMQQIEWIRNNKSSSGQVKKHLEILYED